MNIEAKSGNYGFSKEPEIVSANLADFTVNNFLGPYLAEQENPFLSLDSLAGELKLVIPQLIQLTLNHCESAGISELEIGGTAMEVFSGLIPKDLYWATKKHFLESLETHPEINRDQDSSGSWRAGAISRAVNLLAHGDADLDLYVEGGQMLGKIFNKFRESSGQRELEKTESGGEQFQVSLSDEVDLMAYYGPAYNGSYIQRLHLQLKDKEENLLFHIDITPKADYGGKKILERRGIIGSVHDDCRGLVDCASGQIFLDKNTVPDAASPSLMKIADKEENTIAEIVLREMRKKLFHFSATSQGEQFDFVKLFPLIQTEEVFLLREYASDPISGIGKIVENQTDYQKQMLFQEFFLMCQVDPYMATIFLQDTGMDVVFFGRHLARREVLGIITSPWLEFSLKKEINRSVGNAGKSRLKYLSYGSNDEHKNGFVMFISAVGEALGDHPRIALEHFNDGLRILQNPLSLPELRMGADLPEEEIPLEMYKAITAWGGLTETALHNVLNKQDPEKYPNKTEEDRRNFRREFLKLKVSGFLETSRREVAVSGKERKVLFFYPAGKTQDINDLLPDYDKNGELMPSPEASDFWQTLIIQGNFEQFTQFSSVIPESLALIWINLMINNITTLEALLGIREEDWEILTEQVGNVAQADYSELQTIVSFLTSRQKTAEKKRIISNWIDPKRDFIPGV